jgi:hypothetical protein
MATTYDDALKTLPLAAQVKVNRAAVNNKDNTVGGVPLEGLHCLLYWKLQSGLMRDLGDIMELCKCHLDVIDAESVVSPLEGDDQLRTTFLDILRKAPLEIANERRLGQGNPQNYRHLKDS